MAKLCLFAGTTEGREIVEFLAGKDVSVTVCVATEYGQTLLPAAGNLTVSARRLPLLEIEDMLRREGFDLVIDATHPYAQHVTESIAQACQATQTEYLRLLRSGGQAGQDAVYVADVEAAARYLNTVTGNILLTTGSKEVGKFASIQDFSQRVYARVLPMAASLEACEAAGLKPSHIIAQQGPFSEEMNLATLHAVSAKYLVTKDGGSPGGFGEKVSAAEKAGAKLIVIGRPPQRDGLPLPDVMRRLCSQFHLVCQPEVAVIGIGPGSQEILTQEALAAMEHADCFLGASRMLEAVSRLGKPAFPAIAPETIADYIACHREYRRFAVLLSGDVGFFSGAKKLLPQLHGCKVTVIPGISSLVFLCARLGKSYEDVVTVSLHGRQYPIAAAVRAHRRVFALVGGADGIHDLCAALTHSGLGSVTVSVGERLSYPDEAITVGMAQDLLSRPFSPLSAVLIENDAAAWITSPGLPDHLFQRGEGKKGAIPMTKSEVRAVCLSKLNLTSDAVSWDVGAGTGSVSIEMAHLAPEGQVYAIEKDPDALALLQENLACFSACNVTVVAGTAPDACQNLPAPTHVFLGGSSGNAKAILEMARAKNPRVRIVATAIALESVGELTRCMGDFTEAEVVSLTVARSRAAGPYHLMTGQNPIYIFTMQCGEAAL